MSEIRLFLKALWLHWQALVTGGAVAVVGLAWGQFGSPGGIPGWVFWLVATVCLFVACWRAWLDTHRELVREQKRHQPDLHGSILQTIIGDTEDGKSVMIYLFVEVRNIGEMPSIADNWRVIVSPPTTGPDRIASLHHIPQMTLGMNDGKTIQLSAQDAIYEKLASAPLGFGAKQTGFIVASLPGSKKNVESPGTKLTVEFSDVLGRRNAAYHVWSGVASDPKYFPGVRMG